MDEQGLVSIFDLEGLAKEVKRDSLKAFGILMEVALSNLSVSSPLLPQKSTKRGAF